MGEGLGPFFSPYEIHLASYGLSVVLMNNYIHSPNNRNLDEKTPFFFQISKLEICHFLLLHIDIDFWDPRYYGP